MSVELTLNCKSANVWQLSGRLTMHLVSKHYQEHYKLRPQSGEWLLCCGKLERIDSAGIAYLLDCIRYAKAKQLKLQFKNLPKRVFELMQAQDVLEIFSGYIA